MAIFQSTVFSKLRKSFGNVTTYELNGENIVREKYWKHDCQSPAQLAQRARMKAVKELSCCLLNALCTGFPAKNHAMSINKFISRNIHLMNPDEHYEVTFDTSQLQLSSGELLPPKVTAVIDRQSATVTFTQERQALLPLAPDEDRVYGIVWGKGSKKTRIFPLKLRCEPGTTVAKLDANILKYPLEIFAFTVHANGKKTSRTSWLGRDNPDSE